MNGLPVRQVGPVCDSVDGSTQQLWREHFLFDDCNFQKNSFAVKSGRLNSPVVRLHSQLTSDDRKTLHLSGGFCHYWQTGAIDS